MAEVSSEQSAGQLLSLKVMKMSRPTLELHGNNASNYFLTDPKLNSPPLLFLPQQFGNVYLGETFSCYLSVNNDAPIPVRQMTLKAEVQTSTQKFSLSDTTLTPHPDMLPGHCAPLVIRHEIKELGIHILICSVHYVTHDGERKFFRKFYRFQVLNPLAVKTKAHSTKLGQVFLEVQISNVSQSTMFLERLRLDSSRWDSSDFQRKGEVLNRMQHRCRKSQDLTQFVAKCEKMANVFDEYGYLPVNSTRQYLYKLTPKEPHATESLLANQLGKLDIAWRTELGAIGRLQTSQLTRRSPVIDMIEIRPTSIPSNIYLEQPFTIEYRVQNKSPYKMDLTLSGIRSKMGSVLLSGNLTKYLGMVESNSGIDIELECLSLSPGPHKVGGLKFWDGIKEVHYDIDVLTEINVLVNRAEETSGKY
jgi:hypothetical protein